MCGITGLFLFNQKTAKEQLANLGPATDQLSRRGPDAGNIFTSTCAGLGHRRLSILDVSKAASQPFHDHTGRYVLAFNGEIFNFKELRERYLEQHWQGLSLPRTNSDTEVLLYLLIHYGKEALNMLYGFFAIAFLDLETNELLLARDRFGKKPLLIYQDNDYLAFASEMKALVKLGIPKDINHGALLQYLQLNYIPQPQTIFRNVTKLEPGSYLKMNVQEKVYEEGHYYATSEILLGTGTAPISYEDAQRKLIDKLDASVQERMISDVPLGAFLSGGIDSSVVVSLASRHTKQLQTFSIGYADYPYFDETNYARLVADKFNTDHTVFSLRNADVSEQIFNVLDYLDEPFADSSAIPLYILCGHVRKHVTVALSGDGGDEVFAGYNKHRAELKMRQGNARSLAKLALPILEHLPKSRRNKITNIFRQAHRYAYGATLDVKSRYWLWASTFPEPKAKALLSDKVRQSLDVQAYEASKGQLLHNLRNADSLEDYLATDIGMVLLSDMLVKVDMMSMANSLEVRSPFLDHKVVEFAFSLPTEYKINGELTKRIVQDAFRNILPEELYNRPKRGFEIPLLDFLRTEFKSYINDNLLAPEFIREQGIFAPEQIEYYRKKLFSVNPEDVSLIIWNLVVFQHWYKKYLS